MESRALSAWGWNMLFSPAEFLNFLGEFALILIISWNVTALTLNLKKRFLKAVFHEKGGSRTKAISGPCSLEGGGGVGAPADSGFFHACGLGS